ncbi:hypothetical protein AVEN_89780-1 [Araneus ventricosus]|uniref:Uncharacterized protein n=1 Tax=Araneus ventricosus TaxID=182803 RepID=A0A4Y2VEY9_ARAVE|nr:hypothetical protein AVEN_89780-1 [Araneus ventricosus]
MYARGKCVQTHYQKNCYVNTALSPCILAYSITLQFAGSHPASINIVWCCGGVDGVLAERVVVPGVVALLVPSAPVLEQFSLDWSSDLPYASAGRFNFVVLFCALI